MPTRFYELAGNGAREALEALARRLRAGGARARLLVSDDRTDLYLVVADGDPLPVVTPPAGCRVWSFRAAGP